MAVLLLLLAGTVQEVTWRMTRFLDEETPSPNDSLVADLRNLPEGSELPYGQGVYVRSAFAPMQRYQSELVFAAHCNLMRADWISDTKLRIGCTLREGKPITVKTESHGVTIETRVFRR
ncbi:MAG: hypothetical protein ABIQ72_02575 [Usitatibacter sp.]